MARYSFTADEMAEFRDCFKRTPTWRDWRVDRDTEGHEALDVLVESANAEGLTFVKADENCIVVRGLQCWETVTFGALGPALAATAHLTRTH